MSNITLSMINNAALLLALTIIYEIGNIYRFRLKKYINVLNGVMIGLIGLAIMSYPFELRLGLFFDTRSILIGVSALIFGFVPTSISAVMLIFYRIAIGGMGTLMGCLVITASLVIGLLFRRIVSLHKTRKRWLKLYIFGIIVHVAMLACTFVMPWDHAILTVKQIALPVLIVYPIGVVFLALLLIRLKEYHEVTLLVNEAQSRYRTLFHDNLAVMLLLDPESGNIVDANTAAVAFYGWPESVLKTMNIAQINTLSMEETRIRMVESIEKSRNYFIFKHRRAIGDTVDVEVYSGPIDYSGRTILYSIVHDISSRTAALKALEESEARFRTLIDKAPDAIFVMSDKKFAFINQAGLELLGADSPDALLGAPGASVLHWDYHKDASDHMQNLHLGIITSLPVERVYVRMDKTLVNVDITAMPIIYNGKSGELIFARDITERKRLQHREQEIDAQFRQKQKLEAIGTLAGGVAHEVNNPLNGIMNYAQLILDASSKDTSSAEYASEIIHETERISLIVKNLLQFSRQEKQSHSYASIYDIISQTLSLINMVIKTDQITLDIQLDDNLPDIKCRSQQIQQVIMNLMTNARDALNQKYLGYDENKIIQLRCSLYMSQERRWLRLLVTDNGCGIPSALSDKVFEPFFSTKPKENGTGLGLSISYGIVSEHHGSLTFESEAGKYTRFMLELPVDNGWTL